MIKKIDLKNNLLTIVFVSVHASFVITGCKQETPIAIAVDNETVASVPMSQKNPQSPAAEIPQESKQNAYKTAATNKDKTTKKTEKPTKQHNRITQQQPVIVGASNRNQFVKDLMGFTSSSFTNIKRQAAIRKGNLNGKPVYFIKGKNSHEFQAGHFAVMSVEDLRNHTNSIHIGGGKLHVREGYRTAAGDHAANWFHKCVDVAAVQADNPGALFQVASNFNGLETVSHTQDISTQTLESYAGDPTQGPAASISAAAGLLLRRYYPFYNAATAPDTWQQKPAGVQKVNFLHALTSNRDTASNSQLAMSKAGYVYLPISTGGGSMPTAADIAQVAVGVHRDVQLTFGHSFARGKHRVLSPKPGDRVMIHQVFTAAADLGQGSNLGKETDLIAQAWAKAILKADYEGTLRAAAHLKAQKVFLTLVGGGAFGNQPAWIAAAITNMKNFIVKAGLDVTVIVYDGGNDYRAALNNLVLDTKGTYTLYTHGAAPAGLPANITVKSSGPGC